MDISRAAIYDEHVDQLMKWDLENNPDVRLFTTRDDVINFILKKPEINDSLLEKRIKSLFVIGVSTLAALIIFHREIAFDKMAE